MNRGGTCHGKSKGEEEQAMDSGRYKKAGGATQIARRKEGAEDPRVEAQCRC